MPENTTDKINKTNIYYNKYGKSVVDLKNDFKWKYKKLEPYLKQRVLDIGCGDGRILKLSKEWHGIDFDNRSSILNINRNFKIGTVLKIPYDNNYFDGVIISHVIEHIERNETENSIKEISRILKRGGFIIFFLPNPSSPYWFDDISHINPVSLKCLEELLKINGFKMEYKGYSLFRWFPFSIQRLLFFLFPYFPSEIFFKVIKINNIEMCMNHYVYDKNKQPCQKIANMNNIILDGDKRQIFYCDECWNFFR